MDHVNAPRPIPEHDFGHVRCNLLMHCCMKQAGPAALAPNVGNSRTAWRALYQVCWYVCWYVFEASA